MAWPAFMPNQIIVGNPNSGDDEVPVSDICPMCKTPDSVEEEIRYETISEALERRGGLK